MKQQFLHLCKTRIRVFVVSSASVSIGGIGRNTATHPTDIIYGVSTTHTDKRHIVPVGSSIHARCQGSSATCLLRASNSSQISGKCRADSVRLPRFRMQVDASMRQCKRSFMDYSRVNLLIAPHL